MAAPAPAPGDVLLSASRVLITGGDSEAAVVVDGSTLSVPSARAERVSLAGADVTERVAAVATTPGVGVSNVLGVHILDGSLAPASVISELAPANGGTGASNFPAGRVLHTSASGSNLTTTASLFVSEAGDLHVGDELVLGASRFSVDGDTLLFTDGDGEQLDIATLPAGSAPVLSFGGVAATRTGASTASLAARVDDDDGDHRSVHAVAYPAVGAPPALSAAEVFSWTVTGAGVGAASAAPLDAVEVDVVGVALAQGQARWSGAVPLTGLRAGEAAVAFVVAEDGAGNFSDVARVTVPPDAP